MKKILIFILLFMLILNFNIIAYSVDGITYNDGPEPNNRYYMKFIKDNGTSVKTYYLYLDELLTDKYLVETTKGSLDQYNLETTEVDYTKSINVYEEGSTVPSETRLYKIYLRHYYQPNNLTIADIRLAFNTFGTINGLWKWSADGNFYNSNITILENTIPIKSDGETVIFPQAANPKYANESWFKILAPRNKFAQSGGLPTWTITVGYHLPYTPTFNPSEWTISPHSETIQKTGNILSNETEVYDLGNEKYIRGWLKADFYVPIGTHQIYFTMTNKNTGEVWTTETFTYYNLSGFVDADNNGVDDRTGLPEDIGGVPPEWDLGSSGNNITFEVPDLTTVIETLKSFLLIFVEPVSMLFRGVPELYALMLFGLAIALVKFALGR